MTQSEDLKIEVIEKDIENAFLCIGAFSDLDRLGLKPSQIVSPFTTAFLRTELDGFLFTSDEEIAVLRENPGADTLRSIFQRFISKESTPQQFSSAALPLLLELRKEAFKADEQMETEGNA